MARATNGPLTKIAVPYQKTDFRAENRKFWAKKKRPLLSPNHVPATTGKSCQKTKIAFSFCRFSAKRKNGRFSVIRTRTARILIIVHFFGYPDDPTKFRPIRTKIKGTSLHGKEWPKMAIFRPEGHEKGHNSGMKSRKIVRRYQNDRNDEG